MNREYFYTVAEAAKILGISKTRVRQLCHSGEIEAERDDNIWKLAKHSVHSFRESYEPKGKQKQTSELSAEARDAIEEVKELTLKLGRLEGRLELEAVARSTLEEALQRERERADAERQRVEILEQELRDALRPWWRRLFGR